MSGGAFNYTENTLAYELFGYNTSLDYNHFDNTKPQKVKNAFYDIGVSRLVLDVFNLIYTLDYYESGDIGKEDYYNALNKFKEKWLSNTNDTLMQIIDDEIELLRNDLKNMIERR